MCTNYKLFLNVVFSLSRKQVENVKQLSGETFLPVQHNSKDWLVSSIGIEMLLYILVTRCHFIDNIIVLH